MSKSDYAAFHALDPFFEVVMEGLSKFVDGEHYFDTLADDVLFEFLYEFPGWPRVTRGRDNLIALYSGYGRNIQGSSRWLRRPPMVVAGPAWDRLTAGQMLPLCSYGEQMENRSANVAGGVRRSVSRPGGVRPLPRREAVAGWFCLPRLRRLQGLGA